MGKKTAGLIAALLICAGAWGQWDINSTVAPAGSDPARGRAGAVQGLTGGTPIPIGPVTIAGQPVTIWLTQPVTIGDQPVTVSQDAAVSIVDDSGNPVANAANQATGNASLASIDVKTPALGQANKAGSVPVVFPTDADPVTVWLPQPVSILTDTGTAVANAALQGTVNANTAAIAGDTTSMDLKMPALGQANKAGSVPVTFPSDADPVTVYISGDQPLTETTDSIKSSNSTDGFMQGTTVVAANHVPINGAGAGDVQLVAAVAGKKIKVINMLLISDGASTIRFEDGAGGSELSGVLPLIANQGFAPGEAVLGHFITSTNTALSLEVGSAVDVDGWLVYLLVD